VLSTPNHQPDIVISDIICFSPTTIDHPIAWDLRLKLMNFPQNSPFLVVKPMGNEQKLQVKEGAAG